LVLGVFMWLSAFDPGIPAWLVDIIAILTGTLFLGPVQATSFMVVYDHAVGGMPIGRPDRDDVPPAANGIQASAEGDGADEP